MKHYNDNYTDFYAPMWYHRPHSDLEVAAVPLPGHGCCGNEPDEYCVCVTSGDVALWNEISALSGLSGIDWDTLYNISGISASANLWNSNYNTVRTNSAYWSNKLDSSAFEEISAFWQGASEIVRDNSANWNSAYYSIPQIYTNKENIEKLSADFARQVKIYFDKTTIEGDGTYNSPYTVKDYTTYKEVVNTIYSGFKELYKNNTQQWMSLTADSDKDGINPYLKSLFSAVAVKDTDQDTTLGKHGDLIQWIIEHLGGVIGDVSQYGEDIRRLNYWTANSGVIWKHIDNKPTCSADVTGFTGRNTIWYCEA
jgi:hypothetical protein